MYFATHVPVTFLNPYQVFAYVSQAHKVVLPEGLVDHETLTLEQVVFLYYYDNVTPKNIKL